MIPLAKISICSLSFVSFCLKSEAGQRMCVLKANMVILLSMAPFVDCVFVYVCRAEVPGAPQSNSTCSTHLSPAFLSLTPVLTHTGLFISHLARLTSPPPT